MRVYHQHAPDITPVGIPQTINLIDVASQASSSQACCPKPAGPAEDRAVEPGCCVTGAWLSRPGAATRWALEISATGPGDHHCAIRHRE
ncbi:hypothetical protein PoB_002986600 [Plakobranchus ocellatus]|uniref:Uncharacterized protein n=1 Tax=Plakobranchus ocellatus TaxID=259542 RepID=A0AAV4A9K7_9GAST|nr:hypothetical protein PoB_002986600 [Plakobranchus ocellatus]